MAARGPKPKTPKNSRKATPKAPLIPDLLPTSDMTPVAQAEFLRIVAALDARGMLERADLGVITEAARIKALLDRAQSDVDDPLHALDPDKVRMVTALNSHRLACFRALGLTILPSRSVVKTTAKDPQKNEDSIKALIRFPA